MPVTITREGEAAAISKPRKERKSALARDRVVPEKNAG